MEQGEIDKNRLKLWKKSIERQDKGTKVAWGDTPIAPLPEDNDEAMQVIIDGMSGEMQCPFAWLLEAL